MASDALRSDAVESGSIVVPPGVATPLSPKTLPCVSVIVWNRTGVDLGIGGPSLDTDQHLFPGESYASRVRDLSQLYVFHRSPAPVLLRFTYEV